MVTRVALGRGFTLIELLVVVAIIALLISILLPSLANAREQARTTKCAASLHAIGQAVQTCRSDNRGHCPTWDDGMHAGGQVLLTWVDVLYDLDYLGDADVSFCPTDNRQEEPMVARGLAWNVTFVDHFGAGEPRRPGVRTSYAIAAYMNLNWPGDQYIDTSRQLFAMDGWWTWVGNINAIWLLRGQVFGQYLDPVAENAMHAWRHGRRFGANMLFCDAHVSLFAPRRPRSLPELRDRGGVDTARHFVWLPGEKPSTPYADYVFGGKTYDGDVLQWRNERRHPEAGHRIGKTPEGEWAGYTLPHSFPDHLSANWRTARAAWRKLPARPADRW